MQNELNDALDTLSGWPKNVRELQKQWIGKEEGLLVKCKVEAQEFFVDLFVNDFAIFKRIAHVKISQVHPLFDILFHPKAKFDSPCPKNCFFSGSYLLNPLSNKKLPIFVSSEMDSEDPEIFLDNDDSVPLTSDEIKRLAELSKSELVTKKTHFKLRDWLVSRQRYWGTPIPLLHCDACGVVPVPEIDLPVLLPPRIGNEKLSDQFCPCPKCNKPARRERDTLDTFVDSSWYFLRYPDPHNETQIFDPVLVNQWMPVSIYVGGVEHAILHLLYARFVTRFLSKEGLLTNAEPFTSLLTQGMVCGRTFKDNRGGYVLPHLVDDQVVPKHKETGEVLSVCYEKMSKSKFNGVAPEEVISKYGADTIRLFILFRAPPDVELDWDPKQIVGPWRWLQRLWALVSEFNSSHGNDVAGNEPKLIVDLQKFEFDSYLILHRKLNIAIESVNPAFAAPFHFHLALAALMKFSNELTVCSIKYHPIYAHSLKSLVIMLSPFVPHIAAECWWLLVPEDQVKNRTVQMQPWPKPVSLDYPILKIPVLVCYFFVCGLNPD